MRMKTVLPIQNKLAVREFINFTNKVYFEAGGNYGAIATNADGMMEFMRLLGYEGDFDELIKDLITQHQKAPLYESKMQTAGYCYTPAFAAIYKLQNEVIMIPIPAPEPTLIDRLPIH